MDAEGFDRFARILGSGANRRGVLAALAGLAGLHWTGALAAAEERKVTICHRTASAEQPFRPITVAESAVPEHEAHGDLVACGANEDLDLAACVCRPRAGTGVGCNPPDCPSGQTCQTRPISGSVTNVCCQYAQTDHGCGQLHGEPVAARFTCTETCAADAGLGTRNDLVPCGAQSHCPIGPDTCGNGLTCLPSRCCGFNVCVPVCDATRFA